MDYKQKNLKLKEETLEDWESYLEETPEFSNMTQMIRVAVYDYIRDSEEEPEQPDLETLNEMDDLRDNVSEMKENLQNISNRIDKILTEEERNIENIARDILSMIEGNAQGITPSQIIKDAEYEDYFLVRDALEHLYSNVSFVGRQESGIRIIYFDETERTKQEKDRSRHEI